MGLFFGAGVLVKELTEEAVKAVIGQGSGSLISRISNFHRLLLKAEGKFFAI